MVPRAAAYWIKKLKLSPHPEGGHYRETYRSREVLSQKNLPTRFRGPRAFGSSVHFLLESGQISAFHRLKSDEVWHYHTGNPLVIYVINPHGHLSTERLGMDGPFQAVVKAGCWFGARVEAREGFALVSCTVAPGFDFRDFELGDRREMIALYPKHRDIIEKLTYETTPPVPEGGE